MELMRKLEILSDSAKYDVACTSSGADRKGNASDLGSCSAAGICHTFSADGRCISLLKVLLTNVCIYDCGYCVNRRSNDLPRAAFEPKELADLTIGFYRRNYIEGLFLSSAVLKNPDYTMEQMIKVLEILRNEYRFRGYIHAKTIPGADSLLIQKMGLLADRLSVNIELPSEKSLQLLAPDKVKNAILTPMKQIALTAQQNKQELAVYRHTPKFAPAGQSTQMIVGATAENDRQILRLSEGLYRKYNLKRVFFSAYIPVLQDSRLPALETPPPLLREHRLYQADWLMRFYGFASEEILDEQNPDLNPYLDPKCNWAIHHPEHFPVNVNRADYHTILRVPGIGVKSAKRIVAARREGALDLRALKRIGVVLKRAQYFIECKGFCPVRSGRETIVQQLLDSAAFLQTGEQLSFFAPPQVQTLVQQGMNPQKAIAQTKEEAVECLVKKM